MKLFNLDNVCISWIEIFENENASNEWKTETNHSPGQGLTVKIPHLLQHLTIGFDKNEVFTSDEKQYKSVLDHFYSWWGGGGSFSF